MNSRKKNLILTTLLLVHSTLGFAGGSKTDDMFGIWGAVMLQGSLKSLSPDLDKIKWLAMNQTRTRDDSPQGSRFRENILFGQIGYQFIPSASLWLGYGHDWVDPLNKMSYEESRPYQDFLWNSALVGDFKFMARTRLEERINQTTGNVGLRPRQFVQISHPLPFLKGLSAYIGDEVFFYVNQNNFGKQGFSENNVLSGLSYQFTPTVNVDLGYLGQYVDNKTGNNLFTHNLQTNFRISF
jgi:hypothetical protein